MEIKGILKSSTAIFNGLSASLPVKTDASKKLIAAAIDIAGAEITGILDETNGGTGLNSYTTGDILYASGSNTLAKLGVGTDGQVLKLVSGLPAWAADAGGSSYVFSQPLIESAGTISLSNKKDITFITQPNTGSSLTNFTAVGSPSLSVVSGTWVLTGAAAGNYTQYIRSNEGVLSENSRVEATVQYNTITTTDTGIEIGWQSYNTQLSGTVAHSVSAGWVSHQGDANYGKIIIRGSTNSFTSYSSSSNTTVSANDIFNIKLIRNGLRYTAIVTNTTQGWSLQHSVEGTTLGTSLISHNSSWATAYHKGGAWTVSNFKYIIESPITPDIMVIGDSITWGQPGSNFTASWARSIGNPVENIVSGGGADYTASVVARLNEIIAIKPRRVILMIGGNDILFAISSGTWQANYTNIRNTLVAAGIEVIHALPTPRTATDVSALRTYILANFSMDRIIDTWTPLLGSGTSLLTKYNADNTHPNEAGHAMIRATVNDNLQTGPGSGMYVPKNLYAKNGYIEAVDSGLGADQFLAGSFIARQSGSTTHYLQMGHISSYGYIQAVQQGVGYNNLVLSPAGNSRVGVGEVSPDATLDVKNNQTNTQQILILNHNNTGTAASESQQDFQWAGITKGRIGSFVGAGSDFGLKIYTTANTNVNTTPNIWMAGSLLTGFGLAAAPTAYVHLAASTTSAASLRIPTSSNAPSSPNEGDFWVASNFIKYYNGSATRRIGVSNDTTPTNGQLMIGNGTDYTVAALTQGSGVTITNGSGSITLASNNQGADFYFSGDISVTASGPVNDWAPTGIATASTIRLTANDTQISGISGGADGRILILHVLSASSGNATLLDEDSNSTAANRLDLRTNITVAPGESVILQYDATLSRWKPIGLSKYVDTANIVFKSSAIDLNAQTLSNYAAAFNNQTGTTYTLVAADMGKIVTLSNASAITLTVPASLPSGFTCTLVQLGAGQVTISASGTTVNNRQGHTKIAGQYGVATVAQYTTNVFVLGGDTAA